MRESATGRYKLFQIPMNWMLDTGYASQVNYIASLPCLQFLRAFPSKQSKGIKLSTSAAVLFFNLLFGIGVGIIELPGVRNNDRITKIHNLKHLPVIRSS